MTQQGGVPVDFWGRVQKMIDDAVAKLARSGMQRSSSMTGGRFTLKGGALVVENDEGGTSAYFGSISPSLPDGTFQPGMILRREDGSLAMALYDPFPDDTTPGGYRQFLAIYDRGGRIIFSDDTESGQGIGRPWLSGGFATTRYADFNVSTTATTFETLFDQRVTAQHPRYEVSYRATMDTAGTTGETRVLVNGAVLGSVSTEGFSVVTRYAGPAPVAAEHMSEMLIEIQGRVTSGTGALKVQPVHWRARQT